MAVVVVVGGGGVAAAVVLVFVVEVVAVIGQRWLAETVVALVAWMAVRYDLMTPVNRSWVMLPRMDDNQHRYLTMVLLKINKQKR